MERVVGQTGAPVTLGAAGSHEEDETVLLFFGERLPIAVLTASPADDRRLAENGSEFAAVLAKPIQLTRLYETLCRLSKRPC